MSVEDTLPPAPEGDGDDACARWLGAPDALRLASDALPWQRSLRWQRVPQPRRWVRPALALALLVTVLELAGFGAGMRPWKKPRPAAVPVQVTLIDATPLPLPPEPVPAPFVRKPSRIEVAPPAVKTPPPPLQAEEPSDAMRARMGAAGSVAVPELFNADGTVKLAPMAPAAPRPATERDAAIARWQQIEARGNPLDCHKTRFGQAFRRDESVGDEVARKYLVWIGLADMGGIEERHRQRSASGGCEPAK